jgi:hypothetical protein
MLVSTGVLGRWWFSLARYGGVVGAAPPNQVVHNEMQLKHGVGRMVVCDKPMRQNAERQQAFGSARLVPSPCEARPLVTVRILLASITPNQIAPLPLDRFSSPNFFHIAGTGELE